MKETDRKLLMVMIIRKRKIKMIIVATTRKTTKKLFLFEQLLTSLNVTSLQIASQIIINFYNVNISNTTDL